jgi:hypothetical protein
MKKKIENDFSKLKKASLVDLKKDGIVKSVNVYKNVHGMYAALVEDSFSNSLELLVGIKSAEHIEYEEGLSETLENSAFIVLTEESEEDLRFTTSLYTQGRHLFNFPPTLNEQKELKTIKAILVKKGLQN